MDNNSRAIRYLQRQLSDGAATLRLKTIDPTTGNPYRTRNAWVLLRMRAQNFLDKKRGAKRIVIMPGLRGVGKTTLIGQLYSDIQSNFGGAVNQLYIQADEVVEKLGLTLSETLDAYEELLGGRFEALKKPTFIHIDEVQSDPHWPRIVKFLNERAPSVFFVCTGSSAVQLQLVDDADLAGRRAYIDKLYPLCYVEQQVLLGKPTPTPALKQKIKTALYESENADQVYQRLKMLQPHVNREWIKYDRTNIRQFLHNGTLPHLVFDPDPLSHTEFVNSMVDKVIESDMQALGKFKRETVPAMKQIIYLLAENDTMAIDKLMKAVDIKSKTTIYAIMDAFIAAELLIKVPAYGGHMDAVTNPARYMFMSPAIRAAIFNVVGIPATELTRQGLLLEDYVALHYYREFVKSHRGSLTHPYKKEGGEADFILRLDNERQIAIEIGLGEKDFSQAKSTADSRKCNYGLVFSNSSLGIDPDKTTVKVPLDYLFLM